MRTIRIAIAAPRKAGQGFPVTLWTSDSGQPKTFTQIKGATATIPAGLTLDQDIDDPGRAAGTALTFERVLQLHTAGAPVPKEVGQFVYQLLARGKLAPAWKEWRAAGPTRTLLDIASDKPVAALHLLPWERMRDQDDTLLSLNAGSPFARGFEPKSLSPSVDWPLRVLIANCAESNEEPAGAPSIGAKQEQDALERMFATADFRYDVEYDVLENPFPADIVEACRNMRPHILHFIGHGKAGVRADDHALQLFRPESRPGAQDEQFIDWKLTDIHIALQDIAPRLAFLNACRTSSGIAEPAPVSSLANAFLRAGSAATLGMQGNIAGDLALAFSKAFYAALIRDKERAIDSAVLAARIALAGSRMQASIAGDADWSFPVLTLGTSPHQVLPNPPGPRDTTLAERFVARVPQRRMVNEAIRGAASTTLAKANASRHMVVIVGDQMSGKSHLSKWSAQACRRAGLRAVLVSFDGKEPVDWLDALRWIRDGQRRQKGVSPQALNGWPLSAARFRDFNWGLNQRQLGLTQFPSQDVAAAVADQGLGLAEAPNAPETFPEDTMAQFRDALTNCASDKELVLVLDQLDGIEVSALTRWLSTGLFRPIASGDVQGVRLILVLTTAQYKECRHEIDRMAQVPEVVKLDYFRDEDFKRIARHLCHQCSDDIPLDAMQQLLPLVLKRHSRNGHWGVGALQSVEAICGELAPESPP